MSFGKYKAIKATYVHTDGKEQKFPSQFEMSVYSELVKICEPLGLTIGRNYKLQILPTTDFSNKFNLTIDFAIFQGTKLLHLVEAKGFPTQDFKVRLRVARWYWGEVHNEFLDTVLTIVSQKEQTIISGWYSCNLKQFVGELSKELSLLTTGKINPKRTRIKFND